MIKSGDQSTIGLYRWCMMPYMNSGVLDAMMMCNNNSKDANVKREVVVLTNSLDPVLMKWSQLLDWI
jgi:hypothetical protein